MKIFKYCLMLTLLAAAPAAAQPVVDDFDFFLARQSNGDGTAIGTINDVIPETTFTPGVRVVGAEFEFGGLTDEPGFFNPGNTLPQGPDGAVPLEGDQILLSRVDVEVGDLNGNILFFWDGLGEVDFEPVTNGDSIDIALPLVDEDDDSVILTAGADGSFDGHPVYSLNGGDGVYLLSITAQLGVEGSTTNPVTDPSLPLFIVYGADAPDGAVDAAVDFVTAAIPEPASLSLILLGAAGILRRRK